MVLSFRSVYEDAIVSAMENNYNENTAEILAVKANRQSLSINFMTCSGDEYRTYCVSEDDWKKLYKALQDAYVTDAKKQLVGVCIQLEPNNATHHNIDDNLKDAIRKQFKYLGDITMTALMVEGMDD